MAGPPTGSFSMLSFVFGGVALPLGAVPSVGLAPGTALGPDFLVEINDAAVDLVEATCPATVRLDKLVLKIGPVATGPTYERLIGSSGVQNSATDSPATALLVRKTVDGFSGRLGGRMFWPTPSSVDIDNGGELGTPSLVQFQSAFDAFQDFVATIPASFRVFSSLGGDPRTVESFSVQRRVATQRRRNRR